MSQKTAVKESTDSSKIKILKCKGILMILAVLGFIAAGRAGAGIAVVDGTKYDRMLEAHQVRLHLKGTALLRYMLFIKAYTGALYLPSDADGSQALQDIPKHLVLEYRVEIKAKDFAQATLRKIEDSVNPDEFDRLLPKIEALNRLYRDVRPGDRYSLTYIPKIGTQLLLNNEPLGTIQGAGFARALFSVWLGDNPIDTEFRDHLMGRK